MPPPDSDDDEPIGDGDAGFDALFNAQPLQVQELGTDEPELELLTFGEMVKLVISPCEQMRMMSATPLLDATLVGKRVAVRVVDIGWCAGKVCHRSSSAAVQSYNYAVRYDADDVQLHWLTEARYAGSSKANAANDWDGMDALPAGSWAVFATSELPRAPETGSTAALRAAVGEPLQRRRL